MIVNALDGFYILASQSYSGDWAEVPPGAPGLALGSFQDVVFVSTLNSDDDERVELMTSYWEDGEPTVELRQWAEGWEAEARGTVVSDGPLEVLTSEHESVDVVTPSGGHFAIALFGRLAPKEWVEPGGAREQHMLVIWPLERSS